MPVAAADIKIYGSAAMQETDSGAQGGVIDLTTRIIFDSAVKANSPSGTIIVSSTLAEDTAKDVTVYGRLSGGTLTNEAITLNGLTPVVGAVSFERLMKITVDNAHGVVGVSGTIDNQLIVNIESGVLTMRRPFYNVSADVAGGSARKFYEKVFVKNTHGSLALLSAQITESADPTTFVAFDLENAQNGGNTSTNRVTAPVTNMLGAFDSAAKNVPATNLFAGSGVGCWLELSLAAGEAAAKSTYTLGVTGQSI